MNCFLAIPGAEKEEIHCVKHHPLLTGSSDLHKSQCLNTASYSHNVGNVSEMPAGQLVPNWK